MTRCAVCSESLPEGASLCPTCGHAPAVICPACGSQRLRSQRTCPACGRGWVTDAHDEHAPTIPVSPPPQAAVPAPAGAPTSETATTTGTVPEVYGELSLADDGRPLFVEDGGLPTPMESEERGRIVSVGLALLIGIIALFGIIRLFSSGDSGTAAEPSTTSASPTVTTTTTAASAIPPPVPETTTTTEVVTTTTVAPITIDPIGEAVPFDQLALSSTALEPFEFGRNFDRIAGRLTATLDAPTEVIPAGVSSGEFGTCEGEVISTVRWGRLMIIGQEIDGEMIFVGYRMDLDYDSVAYPGIRTLSGIGIGDTVTDLQETYSSFDLRFATHERHGPVFELYSASSGLLLLWGPVTTSQADGVIIGIYSVDACTLP